MNDLLKFAKWLEQKHYAELDYTLKLNGIVVLIEEFYNDIEKEEKK